MTRKPVIGKDCFLYYSVAWATPTLIEIAQAVDVAQPGIAKTKVGLASRDAGGWNPKGAGTKEMNAEFGYLYEADPANDDEDTVFAAMRDSFENDTILVFYILDGSATTSGVTAQGYRFPGQVFDFPTKQELEAGQTYDIGVEFSRFKEAGALCLPNWYTVTTA